MAYQVITKEQFQKLRDNGYSTEQIANFEKKRQSEDVKPMFSSVEEAKAGQEKAKREQYQAEQGVTPLGVASKAADMASSPLENAMAAGIPDIISKKLTGKPYVDPDSQMKWLSEPAGMIVGPGGAGRLLANAARPVIGKTVSLTAKAGERVGGILGNRVGGTIQSGIKMSPKGIPTVLKDTIGRKMQRGAIEGGVTGGASLASDEEGNVDFSRQADQTVLGAGIGALAVPAGAFISKAGNVYKKWQAGAKTPTADKLKSKISEQQQSITLNTAERNAGQREITDKFATDLDESKKVLQENFDNLSREFQESAETGAITLQDSVKFVSNEMSDSYGAQLGNIGEDLITSGQPITKNELSSVFSRTKQNLEENLITSGHVVNVLNRMEKKYAEVFISDYGKVGKFFREGTGNPLLTSGAKVRSTANDVVDFKSFVKDIKDIKRGIKFGGRTEDNVALGIFYDDLTSFLGKRPGLEQYSQLNQAYTPYIQSLKTLIKQTKANAGNTETQQATNLLKRFGLRKADVPPGQSMAGASPAEGSVVRNVETLQQPSPFSKGMGTQATDPVVVKAQQLAQSRQAINEIDGIVSEARKTASKNLDKRFLSELDNIAGSKKYIESDYTLKESMIKDALASKMKRIGYQQDKIDIIMKDREKFKKLVRTVIGGLGATASVYYGSRAIGSALRGQ